MMSTEEQARQSWQSSALYPQIPSLDQVKRQAGMVHGRIRGWYRLQYVAVAIVVFLVIIGVTASPSSVERLGLIAALIGFLVSAWLIHREGTLQPLPATETVQSLLEYQRRLLSRQRAFLLRKMMWIMLPALPGCLVWSGAPFITALIEGSEWPRLQEVFLPIWIVLCFLVVGYWRTRSLARGMQQGIDEIDKLQAE
jgi:hypothetical protein